MEEIINNLYLGSFAEVQDIRSSISTGFSACLSVGEEFSLANIPETEIEGNNIYLPNLNLIGISHKVLNLIDGNPNVISLLIPESVEFINKYINNGKVYIHCRAGVSRSASIVFAYMLSKGYKPVKAFEILTTKRGVVNPYENFIYEILVHFGIKSPELQKIIKELRSGLFRK